MTQRLYKFECQEGRISLAATGFRMFVREAPKMNGTSQSFSLLQRGGISFEQAFNAVGAKEK